MAGCAAAFPAASSMGVARSPYVSVPPIPCVVPGGPWARAGVIRTASDSCFGGVCWGRAPPGVVRRPPGGGAALVPPSRYALPACGSWCPLSSSSAPLSLFLPFPGPSVVSCSHVVGPLGALSLWAPACHFGPFRALLPECPSLSVALPLHVPFPFPVWWWWGGGGAPMAQAWEWVAWSHLRRVWGV